MDASSLEIKNLGSSSDSSSPSTPENKMYTLSNASIDSDSTSAAPLAVALPRRVGSASKSAKRALWAITSVADSNVTPIDPTSLLEQEDLVKPIACAPVDVDALRKAGGGKRKKACKGCTCGLAELEKEELAKERGVDIEDLGEGLRLEAAVRAANKMTPEMKVSSCGSCYLGDAFRCASCPYRGLPAFSPGEKVELPTNL